MAANDSHYDITVAEFLEFEFYFELAAFLCITMQQLSSYKLLYPAQYAQAQLYVLRCNVSPMCRRYVIEKYCDAFKPGRGTAGEEVPVHLHAASR